MSAYQDRLAELESLPTPRLILVCGELFALPGNAFGNSLGFAQSVVGAYASLRSLSPRQVSGLRKVAAVALANAGLRVARASETGVALVLPVEPVAAPAPFVPVVEEIRRVEAPAAAPVLLEPPPGASDAEIRAHLAAAQERARARGVSGAAPVSPVGDSAPAVALLQRAGQHLRRPMIRIPAASRAGSHVRLVPSTVYPGAVLVTAGNGASRGVVVGLWRGAEFRQIAGRGNIPASIRADAFRVAREAVESLGNDTAAGLALVGRQSGACCYCGRPLTDPRSVAHGYGPVCAGHYGLPWDADRDSARAAQSVERPIAPGALSAPVAARRSRSRRASRAARVAGFAAPAVESGPYHSGGGVMARGIVRYFEGAMHEEHGVLGWRPSWIPHADPLSGMAVAHDVLEHRARDDGSLEHELMALGASLVVRGDSYYGNKGQIETAFAPNLIAEWSSLYGYQRGRGDSLAVRVAHRTRPLACVEHDDDLRAAADGWIRIGREEFPGDPVAGAFFSADNGRRVLDWLRAGYRHAEARYTNANPAWLWGAFAAIEREADEALRRMRGNPQGRLRVRVLLGRPVEVSLLYRY